MVLGRRTETFGLIACLAICLGALGIWLATLGLRGPSAGSGSAAVTEPGKQPEKSASPPTDEESSSAARFPLPAIRPSKFLNTTADAAFVGSEVCAECHTSEHESYLATAHSKALAGLDPAAEPPDVEFHHEPSGRWYTVYRQDGQFRHREAVRSAEANEEDKQEIVLGDYAVDYVIGSGVHSRSYLIERDGFLLESPVTWYTDKQRWGMSPGYDGAHHAGFERVADIGCLFCHAGQVETRDASRYRVQVHQQSIGCESCHGPGSLHVELRRGENAPDEDADLTIVHPARLDRQRREAICAQCHLRGTATAAVRGREPTDFRPGLALEDFRVDYGLQQPNRMMKVVGHVEQMRLSRCYQQSDTLTCTTCHNPHGTPSAEQRVDSYRSKCLTCHQVDQCGLDQSDAKRQSAEDNCMSCHMPQSPTDIPHFSFTHHRVGIHHGPELESQPSPEPIGTLVASTDTSHLSPIEYDRCLGLAYLELSGAQHTDEAFEHYRQQARTLLQSVYSQGLRDGDVEVALAQFSWEQGDLNRAIELAESALRHKPLSSTFRDNALFVIGESYLRMGNIEKSQAALQQLVQSRRLAEDWLLLGVCRKQSGDHQGALEAVKHAAEISASRPDVQQLLASLYGMAGDSKQEAEHLRRMRALSPPRKGP